MVEIQIHGMPSPEFNKESTVERSKEQFKKKTLGERNEWRTARKWQKFHLNLISQYCRFWFAEFLPSSLIPLLSFLYYFGFDFVFVVWSITPSECLRGLVSLSLCFSLSHWSDDQGMIKMIQGWSDDQGWSRWSRWSRWSDDQGMIKLFLWFNFPQFLPLAFSAILI